MTLPIPFAGGGGGGGVLPSLQQRPPPARPSNYTPFCAARACKIQAAKRPEDRFYVIKVNERPPPIHGGGGGGG